ncbi:OB-fold nucleic acid binding domain-containing protein [Lignipirellula cremea]|uniref:DUF5666 domain-containing protein n=1 Tax=Lignipirellula cremea TaxID=2528010 RepID=A0A518DZ37_9BACT|nr:OB-fold nucleic acid binding domain-containing protein [Lignipirellula cremea]QDU97075.1 hypothetical protein Pla8534_49010 [Lignipirellula cremea]
MRPYFRLPFSVLLIGCSLFASACAQEQATAPAPATTPGQAAAPGPAVASAVPANNVVELRKLVGREATVAGRIASTGSSSSGHQFLNFEGGVLSAFCPQPIVAKFSDGKPADLFKGEQVEITGPLSLFKGKLQIKIDSPQAIVLVKLEDKPVVAKQATLKEIGQGVWMSPAGLRYAGRDPAGLTRVDHIRRHMEDQPNRDGPHGVFDGEEGVAWAVIDDAWRQAESSKLRPQVEGDRSTLLVSMNRRIGYLGGSLGKEKGHPALSRVFIVFETDTKNIITAFPR